MNPRRVSAALLPLLLTAGLGLAADITQPADDMNELTVASGTLLRVEVTQRSRLRKGAITQARLLEPIYADNRLLVPTGAVLQGKIIELLPASHRERVDAKFHGDFTALKEPVIEWTILRRADGEQFAIEAESTNGAGGTLYFRSTSPKHVSLIRRAWNSFRGSTNAAVSSVKGPRKSERLKRYFWSQMPLHPQYLEEGSQFEMRLTQELQLPAGLAPQMAEETDPASLPETMWVHSRLQGELNSDTAAVGDPVEAVVTQPVFNSQNQLVLPQNSILHGKVTSVTPSRRWGHDGAVRFSFESVTLPTGFQQPIEGTPMAMESNASSRLSIDQEGGVTTNAQRGLAAPLVMGVMSASAIGDEDGGVVKATASSNGFAVMGRLIALGTSSPFVGGTIGAVGTGRAVFHRWLAHGKQIDFGPDTEIVVEMAPAHSTRILAGQ